MSLLSGYNREIASVSIQPGTAVAGTTTLPIFRAPFGGVTVTGAWLQPTTAVAANGSNYVMGFLYNAGTAGTATTLLGSVGGTAGIPATPNTFTLQSGSADELTEGQYLTARIVKAGSVAGTDLNFAIVVEYVRGKGA